jgi:hypothetical protein
MQEGMRDRQTPSISFTCLNRHRWPIKNVDILAPPLLNWNSKVFNLVQLSAFTIVFSCHCHCHIVKYCFVEKERVLGQQNWSLFSLHCHAAILSERACGDVIWRSCCGCPVAAESWFGLLDRWCVATLAWWLLDLCLWACWLAGVLEIEEWSWRPVLSAGDHKIK